MRKLFALVLLVLALSMVGCGAADYTENFKITNITPLIDGVENKLQIEYEICNDSDKEELEYAIGIDGTADEYILNSGGKQKGEFVFDLDKPTESTLQYNVNYVVKKKDKTVWTKQDVITVDTADILANWDLDYTEGFSVSEINVLKDKEKNEIQVAYSVKNVGKRDDLSFGVTLNGETQEQQLQMGESQEGIFTIDIGRPENYELSYPVKYEVKYGGEILWSKEDAVQYDCTEIFNHHATIVYGDSKVDVNLVDYRANEFDLTELFPNYDVNAAHSVEDNGGNDICSIGNTNADKIEDHVVFGRYLYVETYGKNEVNDTYHFTDDLKIVITDAIMASSVNWEDNMSFTDDAKTNSSYGVTTITMYVKVNNPCDEDVRGTLVDFYVNDKKISQDYLVGSSNDLIRAGSKGELYSITSASVWRSTGEKTVKKFGMHIKLEDERGNVVYDGIQWLDLK